MSSVIELKNKKIIKKDILSTKDVSSQNLLKSGESKATEQDQQKENSSYILPPLNISFIKKAYMEPTSILTKFIQQKTSSINKKININLINYKWKSNNAFSGSNISINSKKMRFIKEKILNNNKNIETNKKSTSSCLLITQKNIINDNKLNNENNINNNKISSINNNKNSNINESNNQKDKTDINLIKNDVNTINKEESFIKEKELNELVSTKSFPSTIKISNPLVSNKDLNQSEANTLSENKIFNSKFRRLCKYLPNINSSLSKSNLKKRLNNSIGNLHHIFYSDIKFQSKTFLEQINLIKENINQYRICINKNNYIEVFKSMPLNTKIKYNKSLEEIFGILLIVPKIILGNYYNLMSGIKEIKIPKKEKFENIYIFDEVKNLIKNNNLLTETNKYFLKSFELYLILLTKADSDDIILNRKDYLNVMSYFVKIRNNLFYVTNSYYNAEKNYNEDLNVIKNINNNKNISKDDEEETEENNSFDNREDLEKRKKEDIKFDSKIIEKIKEEIFLKKNKELEKRQRINNALEIDEKEIKNLDYLGKERKKKKNEYKSIFESKSIDKLLHYCDKKTRLQIISNKVVNEENNSKYKIYKVLKINL